MEPTQTQPNIDPTALALSRSIRTAEGGDYENTSGDAGTSAGAYQFNNGRIPLKKGEIPANFKSWAKELNLDPDDFSQTNQDHVAYEKIKKDLDSGLSQSQIAAKWNSGLTHGWENHVGDVTINGKVVHYDTPAYVAKVQKEYENQMKGKGTPDKHTSSAGSSNNSKKSFDDIPDVQSGTGAVDNLQADTGNSTFGKVTGVLAGVTPGGRLAQGAGYALNNALGGQKGLMDNVNQGIDIQGQLIKQIKDNKAKGKDTTRLEKALKNLGIDLENESGQVSDVGTGGITNKEVLKSAGSLASLPVAAYAGTVLGGGGIKGTETGLESFKYLTPMKQALNAPIVKDILEAKAITEKIGVESLSRQNIIDALENSIKELPLSKVGTTEEKSIFEALKAINPTTQEAKSIIARLIKKGISESTRFLLYNTLGDKVGGLIHGLLPK